MFGMHAEDAYLVCFSVGLVLSIAAFAGGFGHMHLGHFHFGHGHAASAVRAKAAASPINGFTLVAFLTWFGGVGYLLCRFSGLWGAAVFTLAAASGVGGAGLVFWFLAKVLLPRERELTAEDTEMAGVLARVSSAIRPGGTGEIAFSQGGARRAAAARSDTSQEIGRDAEVVVLRYERGVAYVRPWEELGGPVLSGPVLPDAEVPKAAMRDAGAP